jgi:hypothetical protein
VEVSKRHHTVPNFYLKGFATSDKRPRIGAASLDDGKRLVVPTSDATVRKNFYSLDGHPDGSDVFEKELSNLEGDASAVIKKVVSGAWPLTREDREVLGTFLAFQFLRGPDTRTSLDQISTTLLSKVIAQLGADGIRNSLATSGKPVADDIVHRMLEQASQPDGVTAKTTSAGHINHMLELVPELVRYFVGRPWVLIRFSSRKLLTCDTPVALVPNPEFQDVYSGVGLMNAWGITIPLTREVGLLLANPMALAEEDPQKPLVELLEDVVNGKYDHEQNPSTKLAHFFNNHTVGNARRWIFHHPDDAALLPDDLTGLQRDTETEFEVLSG